MPKALLSIGVALLAIVGPTFVLPAASQAPPTSVVAEYLAKDSTDHYFSEDSAARKVSDYGDSLLIRGPIFDKSSGDRVGNYYITLDTIRPHTGLENARLTVRLPGGQILSAGMFNRFGPSDLKQTLAVIGGTGDYERVRGTVTTEFQDAGTAITFSLFLD